jgi:crotonobetainyl-CoA:carnitine CoA-transferase CaiB-like acyl-CoA transferase
MNQDSMLSHLSVVDAGYGLASSMTAKLFAEHGAFVTRFLSTEKDPFVAIYPIIDVWHENHVTNTVRSGSQQDLDAMLASADILIVGGESHPMLENFYNSAQVSARYPHLIVLDIEGYPQGHPDCHRPATDILVQSRVGMAYEHFSDRPIPMSFQPTSLGVVLRGMTAVLAAIYEKSQSGWGQVVSTSLYEGALLWLNSLWFDLEKPTPAAKFVIPKDPYPLIFPCADGVYIHLVLGSAGSKYKLYKALGIDDPSVRPEDSGLPKPGGDPKNFFGDYDLLADFVAKWNSKELMERIWEYELPADFVLAPGACWDAPQIRHNGVIKTDNKNRAYAGTPFAITPSPSHYQPVTRSVRKPLEGVRIVDFGAFVAGPLGGSVLADLGADVIKVEAPSGDPNRGFFVSYTAANRGKRSITIDLKNPEGLKLAQELCMGADAVMNNFKPGVSKRLGIDPETLLAKKPELIVLESPAFGSTGPDAKRSGFDPIVQAVGGNEVRFGGEDNYPLWNRTYTADWTGGWLGALSILVALAHRQQCGNGASIVTPLVNAGIFDNADIYRDENGNLVGGVTLNHQRTGFRSSEALYQTADGWLALVVRDSQGAGRLAATLGLEERLGSDFQRWGSEELSALSEKLKQKATADIIAEFDGTSVWIEPCRDDVEKAFLKDESLVPANILSVLEHPQFGKVTEISPLVRYSRSQVGSERCAPVMGSDTSAILAELGYSGDKIKTLLANAVVS